MSDKSQTPSAGQSSSNSTPIEQLLREKRVLVCCGAGGVGKTTVSACLAVGAAQAGRRVLVVTIDPSKRLAETLGVSRNPPAPVALSQARLQAAGIEPPGSLSAWMLDPKLVSDNVVRTILRKEEDAQRLLQNRVYQNVTAMVAGMQEYTAVEALHAFIEDESYDLVILDTPPSRDALRFLEAPSRAGAFLDKRVFNLFIPGEGSTIRRLASRLLERVMDTAFGANARSELQVFFLLFSNILSHLNRNQAKMRKFFTQPEVGFLLITSPAQEALTEAYYFERKTRDELGLPLSGYVLNRSLAWAAGRNRPDQIVTTEFSPETQQALQKLAELAKAEQETAEQHALLAKQLKSRVGSEGLSWILPSLPEGASDMEALVILTRALLSQSAA